MRHESKLIAATEGYQVYPGDALRFTVTPPVGRWVWVVSVDGRGTVSRLVPAEADAPLEVHGRTTLPGSAILDATPGPERILAFFCESPASFDEVATAIRINLDREGISADGVRTFSSGDLPCEAHATLLLERAGP